MTDLQVRVIGIHDLGQQFNPAMYVRRKATWLREDASNRPWLDWRVPVASRPAQEVRWRDVIILDENNEFVAVQNLSNEPLDNGPGRTLLKNVIRSTATINDTDIDGLPDRWEFQHFAGVLTAPDELTDSGLPALLAYAFGNDPLRFEPSLRPRVRMVESGGERYLELVFRRLLGGEGERLQYAVETFSDDGGVWRTSPPSQWLEVGSVEPWDGTATEIVTLRAIDPITSARRQLARIRVTSPL